MPSVTASTPAPVIAEPKKTGCTSARPVCSTRAARSRSYGTPASSSTNAARDGLVALGQRLHEPSAERGVIRPRRLECGHSCAEPRRRAHRDHRRRQPVGDLAQDALVVRAGAVDLVHEQERRNAEALQRPHEQARLRLHALDGRDHEHGAVEHAEDALDLRDEVRMAGRVDQVDGYVADREGHDRRFDGDAALPLERERVGLRGAGVDAAGSVDHARRVEQAFGESRLTGVYMRQDPQVERSSKQASYPPRS